MRKYGPVIEINMEALMLRRGTENWYQKSQGISLESGKQYFTADSARASRQSERTRRREKERAARESIREERLVASVLAKQLNPIQDGNTSRTAATFNALQSWRQRGHAGVEDEENSEKSKEKPQVSREDTRFTGVVVDDKIQK